MWNQNPDIVCMFLKSASTQIKCNQITCSYLIHFLNVLIHVQLSSTDLRLKLNVRYTAPYRLAAHSRHVPGVCVSLCRLIFNLERKNGKLFFSWDRISVNKALVDFYLLVFKRRQKSRLESTHRGVGMLLTRSWFDGFFLGFLLDSEFGGDIAGCIINHFHIRSTMSRCVAWRGWDYGLPATVHHEQSHHDLNQLMFPATGWSVQRLASSASRWYEEADFKDHKVDPMVCAWRKGPRSRLSTHR